MTGAANLNHLWAGLLVEELVRNGIDTFCIAPGSRSAPLVVAAARHRQARAVVHYDERGAAFHALGHARAAGAPAAVVTTSGSALANVWPAVVEASLERAPLLVLSGDRPPELQDAGANQTMDQVRFFRGYAEWSATLPCPSRSVDPSVVLTTVDQAVSRCRGPSGGVVHLNCMFREPLAPTDEGEDPEPCLAPLEAWRAGERPYTRYENASARPSREALDRLAALAGRRPRGILVAGRLADPAARRAAADLAVSLGWPLLPDVTSGLRLDGRPGNSVPYHDTLLFSETFMRRRRIEAVIHLGGRLTSRRLMDHLEAVRPGDYVVVDDHPHRQDPIHRATQRLRLPVAAFCESLKERVGQAAGDADWLAGWRQASERVGRGFAECFNQDRGLNEPKVAWLVSRRMGAGEGLFLASSMPVRDMDAFGCPRLDEPPAVAANRGASGVDGAIATAAGFARGLGRPTTLLVGDVAFLHDLNSLSLARDLRTPLVVVILNNDGGGIFSFLPIAGFPDVFERYFAAPHGLTFEHAAALFGAAYARPSTTDEFTAAYDEARRRPAATLIEVRTRREENRGLHMGLRQAALEGV